MGTCQRFEPNLWKPKMCKNCLKAHGSVSAPPSPMPSDEPKRRERGLHNKLKFHTPQPEERRADEDDNTTPTKFHTLKPFRTWSKTETATKTVNFNFNTNSPKTNHFNNTNNTNNTPKTNHINNINTSTNNTSSTNNTNNTTKNDKTDNDLANSTGSIKNIIHNLNKSNYSENGKPTSSPSSIGKSNNKHNVKINIDTGNGNGNNEGVKRKKGTASGTAACNSFMPQRWRPSICIHCFEPLELHPNDPNETYHMRTRSDSYLNVVRMDISPPPPDIDIGNGGDDAAHDDENSGVTPPPDFDSPSFPPTPNSFTSTPTSPPSSFPTTPHTRLSLTHATLIPPTLVPFALIPSALKSPPTSPLTVQSPIDEDPFEGFEELDDNSLCLFSSGSASSVSASVFSSSPTSSTLFSSSPTSSTLVSSSSSTHIRRSLERSNSGKGKAKGKDVFSKFREEEDDWDSGMDMEIETFVSKAEYSYVNNKIMEITHVKEEAERRKDDEDPQTRAVLFGVLTAKQMQIQKALDREKINKHDHSKLLEKLNQVRDMLSHPKSGTW